MSRISKTVTFSMPPEMAEQVRQAVAEEGRTLSEFLRDAVRLYMDERKWLRQERMRRRRSRHSGKKSESGGSKDE